MLKHAPYDAAVDVYSLGATFFALLVGDASEANEVRVRAGKRERLAFHERRGG